MDKRTFKEVDSRCANRIKSIESSVKSWFSNYSFFGTSRLENLNGVGYLGAGIPGVGVGCGLPAVSFNRDSLIYASTTIHVSSEPKDSIFAKYMRKVANQIVLGEFTDANDVTLLGSLAEFGIGFTPVGVAQDVRDFSNYFVNWEYSWEHV
jgi:hypothetical protein